MRVTALIENTGLENRQDLSVEHGLSLHVCHNNKQILFDTGATGAFNHNAEKLGIDIQEVDMVVISHHHGDHGGGLAHFLEANQKATIYIREDGGREYFRVADSIRKSIGLDKGLFQRHSDRFVFVDRFSEISPDVFVLTEVGKPYPLPKGNRYLFTQKDGAYALDDFEHELVLVIRERQSLVVFTGCSHSGILNMIDVVVKRFPRVPIKAVFGGFHLIILRRMNTMAESRSEVRGIGKEMLKYPITKVYTGHCTGMKAYQVLKEVLGEKLEYFATGNSIEI